MGVTADRSGNPKGVSFNMFKCQKDSYIRTFASKVVSCEPAKLGKQNGYEVILEDTILFPEGGGQVERETEREWQRTRQMIF